MSHSAHRWLRTAAAAPAAALIALATAVPASAQSSGSAPPSAPKNVTSTYFSDRIRDDITWEPSTDPDDAQKDLKYVVQTDDPYFGTEVVSGGTTSVVATHTFSVTIWAVDPAGNMSEKVTVQTRTV